MSPTPDASRAPGEPPLCFGGNLGLHAGPIDIPGDLRVELSITDGAMVRAARIEVGEAIEAAEVLARADLCVRGGILGREKASIGAGGNLTAKFISSATVHAAGTVTAESGINNARVTCGGRLLVPAGAILGGHVTANGGITARSLGSPAGTRTIAEAGVDEELRAMARSRIAAIEARRHQIQKTRAAVEPLMRNSRNLTPGQKEQATELLYEADEQERGCDRALAELAAQVEAALAQARPEVYVTDVLHAGVIVRFQSVEATIRQPLRGPVQLLPRKFASQSQIVAQDPASGSNQILETTPLHDELFAAIRQTLSRAA